MPTTKIYQAVHDIELTTSVYAEDGKEIVIPFIRGANCGYNHTAVVHGCYYTSDPKVQKAIENDRRYGRAFRLIGEEPDPLTVPCPPLPTDEFQPHFADSTPKRQQGQKISFGEDSGMTPVPTNNPLGLGQNAVLGSVPASAESAAVKGEASAISPLMPVNDVTNRQQALEYLSQEQNIVLRKTTSADQVRAAAEEAGFIFPNWK